MSLFELYINQNKYSDDMAKYFCRRLIFIEPKPKRLTQAMVNKIKTGNYVLIIHKIQYFAIQCYSNDEWTKTLNEGLYFSAQGILKGYYTLYVTYHSQHLFPEFNNM